MPTPSGHGEHCCAWIQDVVDSDRVARTSHHTSRTN